MIRKARFEDIPAMTGIYNEVVRTNPATFDIDPQSLESRTKWFYSHGVNNPIIVVEEEGKVFGYAGLSPFGSDDGYDRSVKLCIYLHKDKRGEGLGSILMQAILELAKQNPNIHTVVSEITSTNEASKRLHESFGFTYCGTIKECGYKFDEYHDMDFYQMMVSL
jgi:L-amino acid N-acyltransferase